MEEHVEVLYPLESMIVTQTEGNSSILDLHVLDALVTTRRSFVAEMQGKTFRPPPMDPRSRDLFAGLQAVGLFLLGRSSPALEDKTTERPEPVSLDTLVSCLKRIEKSVKFWSDRGGRQGYVSFIRQNLPR